MKYYPINLSIRSRNCLVVGGGRVGRRKVATLLECGAQVTVVSLDASDAICALAKENRVALKKRSYAESDLEGIFLVMGATDDEELNRRIHADASKRNILCNIADRPEICDFILPAIVKRGDLSIAISTSGKSPAFAKHLKDKMEADIGDEYAIFLELMGAIRRKLLSQAHEPEIHKPLFNRLISGGLVAMIKEEKTKEINRLLEATLGRGYDYASLMGG